MIDPGLDTCATPVRRGIEELLEQLPDEEMFHPEYAVVYYLISKFDRSLANDYLTNWHSSDFDSGFLPELAHAELEYLVRLEQEHPEGDLQRERLVKIAENAASFQTIRGDFGGDDFHTTGMFRFLSTFDPSYFQAEKAADCLTSENFRERLSSTRICDVIIGLSELDYQTYKSDIRIFGESLVEKIEEQPEFTQDVYAASDAMIALQRIPQETRELRAQLSDVASEHGEEYVEWDVSFDGEDSDWDSVSRSDVKTRCRLMLGHLAAGRGPKISRSEMRWQNRMEKQRRKTEVPQFIATLPSTRLESRRADIKREVNRIITSAEDSLRIATIRMDMMHDELINRIQREDDLEVKLLTSTGTASGARTKMKKAVMNEMVKRLEGNVREDELMHARMVIGDEQQAVISTADLTRDQLVDEFNAGVYTRNDEFVEEATEFFEKMWDDAEARGTK